MNKALYTDVGARYKRLDDAVKSGRIQLPDAINRYAWLARKDLPPGNLAMAQLNAAQLETADDVAASIGFTISTYEEDRDGDVVVPMGCRTHNYINNPVIFFGHQDKPIPIAKATAPDGKLHVFPQRDRITSTAFFDRHDEDAMFIFGKIKRGFLSAASIAFVPIVARRREDVHKAQQFEDEPDNWIFDEIDMTEWSVVGVPSNAGAIRDALDQEKSFIRPRLQKALAIYAAKSTNESGGCWTGWCPLPKKSCGCSGCDSCSCGVKKSVTKAGPWDHLAGTFKPGQTIKINGLTYKVVRDLPDQKAVMVVDPKTGTHISLDYINVGPSLQKSDKKTSQRKSTSADFQAAMSSAMSQLRQLIDSPAGYNRTAGFTAKLGQLSRKVRAEVDAVITSLPPKEQARARQEADDRLSTMLRTQLSATNQTRKSFLVGERVRVSGEGFGKVTAVKTGRVGALLVVALELGGEVTVPESRVSYKGKALQQKAWISPGDKVTSIRGKFAGQKATVESEEGTGTFTVKLTDGTRIELREADIKKSLVQADMEHAAPMIEVKAVAQSPKDGKWYVIYQGKPIAGPYNSKEEAEKEQYRLMSIQQMGRPGKRLKADLAAGDKVVFRGPYGTEQGTVVSVSGGKVKVRSAAGQTHTVDRSQVGKLDGSDRLPGKSLRKASGPLVWIQPGEGAWVVVHYRRGVIYGPVSREEADAHARKYGRDYDPNYAPHKSLSTTSGAAGGYTVPTETKDMDIEYDQGYVAALDGRARSTNPYRNDNEGRGPQMRQDWDAGWVDGAKERLSGRKAARRQRRKSYNWEPKLTNLNPRQIRNYLQPILERMKKDRQQAVSAGATGMGNIEAFDAEIAALEQAIQANANKRLHCTFCKGSGSGCGHPGDCPDCGGRGYANKEAQQEFRAEAEKSLRTKAFDDETKDGGIDTELAHVDTLPHELAIARAYKAAMAEADSIAKDMEGITPFDPQSGEPNKAHGALSEYGETVKQRMESIKQMWADHAPDKDLDEALKSMDFDADDKAMETSGNGIAETGEANLIDRGQIPDIEADLDEQMTAELGDDAVEQMSEIGSEEWAAEEAMEPQHMADEDDVEKDDDDSVEKSDDADDIEKDDTPATEEVLERYEQKGRWHSRKAARSTIDRVLRQGGMIKRGIDGRQWLVPAVKKSVRKALSGELGSKWLAMSRGQKVQMTDAELDQLEAYLMTVPDGSEDDKNASYIASTPSGNGYTVWLKKSLQQRRQKSLPTEQTMALDEEHSEAVKACGNMLKGLAVAHDMPEHHKSALDMHGDSLHKALANEGDLTDAVTKLHKHVKSLAAAPDVPTHHKEALNHHAKAMAKVLKALDAEPVEEQKDDEELVAKEGDAIEQEKQKSLFDQLRNSMLEMNETTRRVGLN